MGLSLKFPIGLISSPAVPEADGGAGQGWGAGERAGALGDEAWFARLFSHVLCVTHNREQVVSFDGRSLCTPLSQ